MNNLLFYIALAASAMGHTTILGFSPEAPATTSVAGNLSTGNTATGQTADRSGNVAVHGNVSTTARGLTGVVAAAAMTKLDWPSGGIIAVSPFPPAWDQARFAVPSSQNHQVVCATFVPGQADWQFKRSILTMQNNTASNTEPKISAGSELMKMFFAGVNADEERKNKVRLEEEEFCNKARQENIACGVTVMGYLNKGTIKLEGCNKMNIPVNCFIQPPDEETKKWTWFALNYMPRKDCLGGEYQIEADSQEVILAAVNKFVVPLYEAALSNLKATAENYYWENKEE